MFAISLGLTLGLISSLHCIGMCGPLIIAIPKNISKKRSVNFTSIVNPVFYNLGRILTYVFIGVIIGLFGQVIKLAFLQEQISIFAGVFMLVLGLTAKVDLANSFKSKKLNLIVSQLKSQIARLLKNQSYFKMFLLGVLNGFLPCGMVYMAVASSLALPNMYHSMLFMASFGVGTSPLLISLFMSANLISTKVRVKLNKYVPILTMIIGLLVVLRGMNLGIPYISPDLNKIKDKHTEKMDTKRALDNSKGGYCY